MYVKLINGVNGEENGMLDDWCENGSLSFEGLGCGYSFWIFWWCCFIDL